MYCKHFGLSMAPFRFSPPRQGPYIGIQHREAVAVLEWGLLHEPSGFTMLVGEPGVGKTTLLGHVLRQHHEYIRTVSVPNPKLTGDEILRSIVDQLDPGPSRPSKLETLYAFERSMDRLRPGERLAIIIDEAQALSDDALEEVRLLSNCGRGEERQLQLLLIGQPELLRRLASPPLRQLDQRVGARAILSPLQRTEAYSYVKYLVQLSGGRAERIFTREAIDYLIELSGGIPRRINMLSHRAMLQAYIAGSRRVTLELARTAVAEEDDPFVTAAGSCETRALSAQAQEQLPGTGVRPRATSYWSRLGVLVRPAGMVAGLAMAMLAAVIIYVHHPIKVRIYVGEDAGAHSTLSKAAARRANALQKHAHVVLTAPVASAPTSPPAARPGELVAQPPRAPAVRNSLLGAVHKAVPRDSTQGAQTSKSVTSATPDPTAEGSRQIAVRKGDTLDHIAIQYLGSEQELARLIRANPQFSNINRIYPGEIVYLPSVKESAQAEASP